VKYLYLIFRLFFTPKCIHVWVNTSQSNTNIFEKSTDTIPVAILYSRELQCKNCGDIKFIKERIKP